MQTRWTGCGPALVTPFTVTGELDEAAITRLARRQINSGVNFLVPCGTTGESPALSHTEKLRVVELVVQEADGEAPVLAGAGGYDTRAISDLVSDMELAGANGILSVTPYYNKPTQNGLFRHFETLASRTTLPIVLYNVPGRTGCNIEPSTLVRLSTIPSIVGVKEASGDLGQMCEICRIVPKDFCVLSGDDAFTLAMMSLGATGVVSVVANEVPEQMVKLVQLASEGDFASARSVHERLLPLMQANFVESNPIPVKAAMAALGLIKETYRLPMVELEQSSRDRITTALKELGLTLAPEARTD